LLHRLPSQAAGEARRYAGRPFLGAFRPGLRPSMSRHLPTSTDPPTSAPGQASPRSAAAALAARLEVAQARLDLLFEASGDGLLLCDDAGLVRACNGAAAELLQVDAAHLVGRSLRSRLDELTVPASGGPAPEGALALRRPDGQTATIELLWMPLPGIAGAAAEHMVRLHDLSDDRRTQQRLLKLANFDSLTGLPNRALFRDRLAGAMRRARRNRRLLALMFLDLDRFKVINDSLGHEAGDRLLQHVAQVLSESLRGTDSVGRAVGDDRFTVSRLGGDEFTVIAEGLGGADDAVLVAQRLLDALATPFKLGEEEIVVSASIGITLYPVDDVDLDGLLRHADMAMYRAKALGRGIYCFFSEDLQAAVAARLSLENALRRALERDEFMLHFQPKARLADDQIVGVEALLRWRRPGRGMVPPDRFIAVLEETGLILQAGAWVIRSACTQLAAWDRAGAPPLRLAINISARQFRHATLARHLEDTLVEHEIDPSRIDIELTESMLMEDNDATRHMLANFARIGVRLALDDFGTGHSSLSYLKRFNVDSLKVDRSFVSALPDDSEDRAIAQAVIVMAHSLQMSVVAEGVETIAQAESLHAMGCDEVQGYLVGRPMPAEEFLQWLARRKRRPIHRRVEEAASPAEAPPQVQRIDLDGTPQPQPAEGSLTVWAVHPASLESAHAPARDQWPLIPIAGGLEPGAAGGGDVAGAAGIDTGWCWVGQDARADDAHRVAAADGPDEPCAGAGGDVHQQGRQGNAGALGGHAAGERARHVDRHLPRPVQPVPARALEARGAAAGLPDPGRAG
jgi:diguanylate cyclase (GGDEF)-like protein